MQSGDPRFRGTASGWPRFSVAARGRRSATGAPRSCGRSWVRGVRVHGRTTVARREGSMYRCLRTDALAEPASSFIAGHGSDPMI
jgi:hypothetical protein